MIGNKYNQSNKMRLSTKTDRRTDRERRRAEERYGQMVGTGDPATGSHAHRHRGRAAALDHNLTPPTVRTVTQKTNNTSPVSG